MKAKKKPSTTKARKKRSAAFFTALPRALQLTCLTMLPLEDMLDFAATSHDMHRLCADDVVWRPIYEDLVGRCCMEGVGEERQKDLEKRQRRLQQQLEQQPSYKAKTLTHLVAYFEEWKREAEEIISDATFAEFEAYFCSSDYRCPCQGEDESDSEYEFECGHCPDPGGYDYTYDNWGEEEWTAQEEIGRL